MTLVYHHVHTTTPHSFTLDSHHNTDTHIDVFPLNLDL